MGDEGKSWWGTLPGIMAQAAVLIPVVVAAIAYFRDADKQAEPRQQQDMQQRQEQQEAQQRLQDAQRRLEDAQRRQEEVQRQQDAQRRQEDAQRQQNAQRRQDEARQQQDEARQQSTPSPARRQLLGSLLSVPVNSSISAARQKVGTVAQFTPSDNPRTIRYGQSLFGHTWSVSHNVQSNRIGKTVLSLQNHDKGANYTSNGVNPSSGDPAITKSRCWEHSYHAVLSQLRDNFGDPTSTASPLESQFAVDWPDDVWVMGCSNNPRCTKSGKVVRRQTDYAVEGFSTVSFSAELEVKYFTNTSRFSSSAQTFLIDETCRWKLILDPA